MMPPLAAAILAFLAAAAGTSAVEKTFVRASAAGTSAAGPSAAGMSAAGIPAEGKSITGTPISGGPTAGNSTAGTPIAGTEATGAPTSGVEELSLEQACELALARNPEIAAARLDPEVARGQAIGAGRLEDPEVAVEAQPAKQTLVFSQSLAIGVIGGQEAAAAERGLAWARRRYDQVVREVMARVARAYFAAYAAAERTRLARELSATDEQMVAIVKRRFAAGDASRLEVVQAEASALGSRDRLAAAQAEARQAEIELSVLVAGVPGARWALRRPVSEPVPGPEDWERSPEVQAMEAAVLRTEAERSLAAARRWPGFTLSAGAEISSGAAGLVGVSAPLPVWNRQEGELVRADAALQRARAELESARNRSKGRLAAALTRLELATQRVRLIEGDLLPRLKEAYQLSLQGVREGALSVADSLEPRREWQNGQAALLDAIREQGEAMADLQEFSRPRERSESPR